MKKIKLIFSRIFREGWNSPTLTEWLNRLIQPLRLLLVTPLILTKFNEIEVASWYLFASISFLGVILQDRVGITFSRMVSMALGGRNDLSPVTEKLEQTQEEPENWSGIVRVYRCLFGLNLFVVVASVGVSSCIGVATLRGLLAGEEIRGAAVWSAFTLMMISQLILGSFQFLAHTLRGLNHVALLNRWQVVINLVSIVSGFLVLYFGGGILELALVMQGVLFLGLVRNFILIRIVNEGRLKRQMIPRWDSEIFGWAWPPLWKGLLGQLAIQGTSHLGALILSWYLMPGALASYLFSMNMLNVVKNFSMTPFSSQLPRFTRLMVSGKLDELRMSVTKRMSITSWIFVIGVVFGFLFLTSGLNFMDTKVRLLPFNQWLLLSFSILLERFNTFSLTVCGFGNHVALFLLQPIGGLVGVLLLFILVPRFQVFGAIAAFIVPGLIVTNVMPAKLASERLDLSLGKWIRSTALFPFLFLLSIFCLNQVF